MAHPRIQIVDENDNPIGGASMDEAQFKGLYHRIVRVMIENEDGEVLLQKRSPHMLTAPNLWDHSASGHVDEGETYEESAQRELFEEIEIKTKLTEVGKFQTKFAKHGRTFNRFNKVYRGKITKDTKLKIDENEVSVIRWYKIDDLKKRIDEDPENFTDGINYVIKNYY